MIFKKTKTPNTNPSYENINDSSIYIFSKRDPFSSEENPKYRINISFPFIRGIVLSEELSFSYSSHQEACQAIERLLGSHNHVIINEDMVVFA